MDNVLKIRRQHITAEVERLRKALAGYEAELAEIEAAERVIARYTGAERREAGPITEPFTAVLSATPRRSGVSPDAQPSVPDMVVHVLMAADRQGRKGLEPAEAYEAILDYGWSVNKDTLRAAMWKMAGRGKLKKVGDTSTYALPDEEKPADAKPEEVSSAGLFSNPEHGREAGQGGGT